MDAYISLNVEIGGRDMVYPEKFVRILLTSFHFTQLL